VVWRNRQRVRAWGLAFAGIGISVCRRRWRAGGICGNAEILIKTITYSDAAVCAIEKNNCRIPH
jgi:hypothetical protein